jgi:hypothetical protein
VHTTTLEVTRAIPSEVEAGAAVTIEVRVSCAAGCRFDGAPIEVVTAEGVVVARTQTETADSDDASRATELVLTAPNQIGAFVWDVVVPLQEPDGGVHEEPDRVPMPFTTIPHKTSLAVWNVRSPIIAESAVMVKVGMRCSAACRLTGRTIEVVDQSGVTVAEALLGETPWTGTDALYWAEVEFRAPASEGVAAYRAVTSAGADPCHEASTAGFSFRTTGYPEHKVTINVVDKDTGVGVSDVEVRLGLYIQSTDQHGNVHVEVPSGTYDLSIRKDGFGAAPVMVEIAASVSLRVEGIVVPTMAEIAPRITAFEGFPWG